MYTHRAFVTSVRASVFAPQIAASASLSFFGAKIPFFAFFIAATSFLLEADRAFLPAAFFSAVRVLRVAFVRVVRVFVVAAAVFVALVVVIAIEEWKCTHALSL